MHASPEYPEYRSGIPQTFPKDDIASWKQRELDFKYLLFYETILIQSGQNFYAVFVMNISRFTIISNYFSGFAAGGMFGE